MVPAHQPEGARHVQTSGGDTVQQWACERADELPGTGLEHPFGPAWDVFKVCGKVFMLLTELGGEPLLTLKASPQDARALREQYAAVTPGYHMNKKHWITLRSSAELDRELVQELVTESYLLVLEALPRHRRPVDPATFGVTPS
ncbi:MAG: MmcQ/YjbR family DNA-binding protein [Kocuria sp.]|uniref:MmcQ/YjbR family DNA-binding protein n=1 Tax=Kocuria TaxID=57493 RepID=UPI0011A3C36B|nr:MULTISPECIES: MmcQ/YjbR family DNA-binding protein [Kocuria]MBS6029985.1 MmcQ/YjbR family DNA-binding protein [Kocuria rhizophila]MDO4256640.1 MmcQ/YjbR family DNA-binding protein [Kocuria sp.]